PAAASVAESAAPTTPDTSTAAPETTALEPTGNFDAEACLGRFEILSRAGNITFRSASATLNVAGSAILNQIVDIISRCPDIRVEIGGHTDDDGSDAANMRLSERRAAAVKTWLVSKGIAPDRLVSQGYGEANPLVPNDSSQNMARNRRIEFRALN
ncbi:MAG: OmpA family protein, partial [Candidatus Saccharibacteria bacterium]|nr:OmpA family protein [Pseudorhodobacter sp.]